MPELRIDTSRRMTGIILTMTSITSFAFMNMFAAKNSADISVMTQMFFRNLVGLIIVGCVLMRARLNDRTSQRGEWKKYNLQLFARSLFGFIGMMMIFYALRNARKADVIIMQQTSLFMIPIVSAAVLGEKLTKSFAFAAALAFAGAFIAANPTFDSSSLPLLSAFGNAVMSTTTYILLSYFSGRVPPLTIIFYFCTFSSVVSLPLMLASFSIPNAYDLFYLIMIGVCAALAQITLTYSYRFMPAGEISIYNQSAIPINAALGYLFFGEIPGARTITGAAAVITASVLLFISKKTKR